MSSVPNRIFTSESVTEGHPDKICDQISDAVLDYIIKADPRARVACETFCTTGIITVMGEISTVCYADIPKIARAVVNDIGYNDPSQGFDGNTCAVVTSINEQSPDIALGVDHSMDSVSGDELDITGAGDQGMMFGYACSETPELMPLPISLAHTLAKRLSEVRKTGLLPYLRPDGKTQVTVAYDRDRPVRIDTVVVSSQHADSVSIERLRKELEETVIREILPARLLDRDSNIFINPTGRFVTGGPAGDTGLTGRKIIVDTYGGFSRHGGGSFSGKDPTKVDRSAAYAARYAAKNVVAAGLAEKCELQLAYAIGVAHPVSVMVETFGTGKLPDEKIADLVKNTFDFRPAAIIRELELLRPIYRPFAAYGHMGREELNAAWEKTDRVERLQI